MAHEDILMHNKQVTKVVIYILFDIRSQDLMLIRYVAS